MKNQEKEEFTMMELFIAVVLILAAFSIGSIINQL